MVGENKMELSMGNYTGPYWSNGKYQESVEFGDAPPLSALDELSRLHDTAYAHFKDARHREAADNWYGREAKKLGNDPAAFAGNLVQYGNYSVNQGSKLYEDWKSYGPLGLIKFVYGNLRDQNQMVNGTYLANETKDLLDLFDKDPRKLSNVDSRVPLGKAREYGIGTMPAENVKFSPVVDVRGTSHGAIGPAPVPQHRMSSEEVAESRAGTDYYQLPFGKRLKKKKRKAGKKQLPELKHECPTPKLAGLVNPVVYRDYAERQPKTAGLHFDPSWNVNPLKMRRKKNKVLPSL